MSEFKVHAIWSIKKETILNIKEDGDIESEKFDTILPNVQYSVILNFDKDETIIYLDEDTEELIKEMKFFIASANIEGNIPADKGFTKRKQLLKPANKFFVNDILTIEIRGTLRFDTPKFDLLDDLWENDDKDFTLVANNGSVKVHKFIIGRYSAIFAAAIRLNKNKIEIKSFECDTVNSAVELCYERDGRSNFSFNGLELIKFASTFDMPLIKNKVEHKLKSFINAKTVCEFANKSLEYKAEILLGFCINFVSECIKNGKSFDGTLTNLNSEVKALVFNNLFPQVKIS